MAAIRPAALGLRERWALRSPGERAVIALIAGLVVLALAWLLAWEPMQRDIERMQRTLVAQRATLAEARRQADDAAALARAPVAPPTSDARADLDAVLARQSLKPSSIERTDSDRLRVTFDTISFDALVALLDSVQRDARLRTVELAASGRVEPGQVRADVTFAR
jgi:type II secretory pathway component PulM